MKKQFYDYSNLPNYAKPIFDILIQKGKIDKNFTFSDTAIDIIISKYNRGEFNENGK